jgi:hypothetical protein
MSSGMPRASFATKTLRVGPGVSLRLRIHRARTRGTRELPVFVLVVLALVGAAGCRRTESAARVNSQPLSSGLVARVGPWFIPARMVETTARANGSSATRALERITQDALLAAHARVALMSSAQLRALEAAVLARVLLEDIQARARARGLPSDEELAAETKRRWVEFDRPSSSRTTHAVARVKRPQQRAEARDVAEHIARATRGARDAEDFKRRASAVNPGAIEVVVESLPPITEDGRAVPVGSSAGDVSRTFDARFARACNELARPGDQSDVVESQFGWHVIRLEERLPAVRMPAEERRRAVASDVYRMRASREHEQLLRALRTRIPVVVKRNAAELTGLLKAGP